MYTPFWYEGYAKPSAEMYRLGWFIKEPWDFPLVRNHFQHRENLSCGPTAASIKINPVCFFFEVSVVLANNSWHPLDRYLLLPLPTKKGQWQQQGYTLPICLSLGKKELCFWVGWLVWSSHPTSAWHWTRYWQSGVSLCLLGHLGSVYVYITAPWPWLFPYRPLTQQPKVWNSTYYQPAPLRLSALYPSMKEVVLSGYLQCAACCRWPCFGRGFGLDDPQRSLPTPNILWFCDSKCLEHISFCRSNTFYEFHFLFF